MARRFAHRTEAGHALAAELQLSSTADSIVLALPRGGVPVAAVVAKSLGVPLDIIVVRKVGAPRQPELAMGAIASIAGSIVTVHNDGVLRSMGRDALRTFDDVAAREREELERREALYREDLPPLDVRGKAVIIVDDGIATGATMRAAVSALESTGAASVTIAVPVCSADSLLEFTGLVDRVVCVSVPEPFWAVGQAYEDFTQTTDDEVRRLLAG